MEKDLKKIMENVIEITWISNQLSNSGKIKSLPEIGDSRTVRDEIEIIAENFEKEYAGVDWDSGELDYVEEMEHFAKQRLIMNYGRTAAYELSQMITISTAHISRQTAAWIEMKLHNLPLYKKEEYGWFIYPEQIPMDGETPDDLIRVL